MPDTKTIFISADHGLSLVYFLQTDVLPALLESGLNVVVLTDDGIREQIAKRFERPGLHIEGLRFQECRQYFETKSHSLQHWTHFLRWMGGSDRVNTNAMDGHLRQMGYEASPRGKQIMPLIRGLTGVLRKSRLARRLLVNSQRRFTPDIYGDLFEKYQPSLVVASTPGWRWDRYLLREAAAARHRYRRGDCGLGQPLSYRLPGAPVNWINCWSEIQKQELVLGSDWDPAAGQHRRDPLLRRLLPQDLADAARGVLRAARAGPAAQAAFVCVQFCDLLAQLRQHRRAGASWWTTKRWRSPASC